MNVSLELYASMVVSTQKGLTHVHVLMDMCSAMINFLVKVMH